jgi:hypothetical protein
VFLPHAVWDRLAEKVIYEIPSERSAAYFGASLSL